MISAVSVKDRLKKQAKEDEYMEKAFERLMNISADEEKQLEYEAREKAIMDHNYLMRYNWEEGMKEGVKIGLIETCKELGLSKQETTEKLMKKYHMQKEKSTRLVDEYWEKSEE